MAKEKSDDDVATEQMSEDSLAFLDQARKGKARTFVMSVKGAAVRSLTVKKKSVKDGELKDARGQGFHAVFGTVSGSGTQLTFTIARADGFEEVPGRGKVDKLKKFLSEQTGKTFKPEWLLVDELAPLPFDDEELQHPLIARFVRLEPQLVEATQRSPDLAAPLKKEAAQIRDLLTESSTIDQAASPLTALENRVAAILAGYPSVEPTTSSTPQPTTADAVSVDAPASGSKGSDADNESLAAKLAEGLKRLRPLLEQVIAVQPNLKDELVAAMGAIVTAIKAQRFDQARQDMLSFGARLKSLLAQPTSSSSPSSTTSEPPSSSPGHDASELIQRRALLEPLLLQAQAADREKSTTLGAVWQMIADLIDAQNLSKAAQALNSLEKSIHDILASTANKSDAERLGIREGIVQEMQDRIRGIREHWTDALQRAALEVRKVQLGVQAADPELAEELRYVLEDYSGKLIDLAMRYEKAKAEADAQKGIDQIRAEVDQLKSLFKQDPVLPFLERYPFQTVSVTGIFKNAFTELDKMLKA